MVYEKVVEEEYKNAEARVAAAFMFLILNIEIEMYTSTGQLPISEWRHVVQRWEGLNDTVS